MSYIDKYKNLSNAYGLDQRSTWIKITQLKIQDTFKNSPNYYQVTRYAPSSPSTATTLDVWVIDKSDTKDYKEIQAYPSQTINYGDIVSWQNDNWLVLQVDNMGDVYERGYMQKCLSSLKWLDSGGNVKEAYFTVSSQTQRGLGLQDGNVIILPNERRYIAVQNNADTLTVVKGQRFIFDNGRAWRCSSINTLLTGLVEFELEETQFDSATDNLSLRIANYYKPANTGSSTSSSTTGSFTVNITGSDYCKVTTSQTYTGQVLNSGSVDPSKTLSWQLFADDGVSSTTLATITSQSGTSATIKADASNQYGYVKLIATCVQDNTIVTTKRIQIKSLI